MKPLSVTEVVNILTSIIQNKRVIIYRRIATTIEEDFKQVETDMFYGVVDEITENGKDTISFLLIGLAYIDKNGLLSTYTQEWVNTQFHRVLVTSLTNSLNLEIPSATEKVCIRILIID